MLALASDAKERKSAFTGPPARPTRRALALSDGSTYAVGMVGPSTKLRGTAANHRRSR